MSHFSIIYLVFLFILFEVCKSQFSVQRPILRICTINKNEFKKCRDWQKAVAGIYSLDYDLECHEADGKHKCMQMIEDQKVDLVNLDPGEVYIAGRYHSLIPIVYEQYGPTNQTGYYAVAVVKTSEANPVLDLKDLRNRRACFGAVGQIAGWVLPIVNLLEKNLIDVVDCNNIIQNAANFFAPSCAPNALIDKYNPIGTNPQSMCSLCAGGKCDGNDLYANSDGALLCLTSGGGEVAFVRHSSVDQLVRTGRFRRQDFQLLCPNGLRSPVDNYQQCNWGSSPPNAVVISSVVMPEIRKKIQNFLLRSSQLFRAIKSAEQISNVDDFALFSSLKYGGINLLFSDDTSSIAPVDQYRQSIRAFFGLFQQNYEMEQLFAKLRKCPVSKAKLCVVSDAELGKCFSMKSAFHTQQLQPEIACVRAENTIQCMKMIRDGQADITMLDAADVAVGGAHYSLEPIVSEQNNLNDSYYVVAITKKADPSTDLLYLKNKRSCHAGYKTAAGWVIPMAFLMSNFRVRPHGCDAPVRAASEFFSKSCIPGALSKSFNHDKESVWEFGNLCDLCAGNSYRYCSRDSSEPYFGDSGALRCLVERGGDVAFAKHTAIFENLNGRNQKFWARNKIDDDFELLCRDGSRAEVRDFAKCNLGHVSSNALVTNRFKPYSYKEAYVTLFIYAQQFFGSKYSKEYTFKMFVSNEEHKDLIFQDSTVKLKPVSYSRRDYRQYLGHEFLKAMSIVDCTSSSGVIYSNLFVWTSLIVLLYSFRIF